MNEALPETEPEWIMINAARRVMAEFGCVDRIWVRVNRDESFDNEWQEISFGRAALGDGE